MNKKGYKNTALGWIPEDWEVKAFGAIVNRSQYGVSLPSDINGTYPIVSMKNIQNGRLNLSNLSKIIIEDIEVEGLKLRKDDFLFNRTNSYDLVGKSVLVEDDIEATFASYLVRFEIIKEEAFPKFVYYFFNSSGSDRRLKAIATKAVGQANINPTILQNDFQIPLPLLSEQRHIAAILSTWDSAIAKEQQLIDVLGTRHRALMQQLLSGKRRLKRFDGKWVVSELGDLFDRVVRRNLECNTTIVTISAQRGFVMQTDFFNKTIASDITDNYFLVERGEFCYNKSYSNGYPWGAIKRLTHFEKAVVTTLYICFKLKDENQNSATFFEHFFEAGQLDKGLMQVAHEGGRAHGLLNVTPRDFFQLKILSPSLKEQTAISNILTTSDQEVQTHRRRLAALKQQKKGLMQVLLTGRVRVTPKGV